MAIDYPTGLRGPLNSVVKTQAPTFTASTPFNGPANIQFLSTDAPVTYELTFMFRGDDALSFRAWIEDNDIYRGAPFNCPIKTECAGKDGAQLTQEVRVIEGDIRSFTQSLGFFIYTAIVECRKETNGLEQYCGFIGDGSIELILTAPTLDEALN